MKTKTMIIHEKPSESHGDNTAGLTAIAIENFKGIGEPVTVPLRPITLLFGANSAGKSTIIQALQYAWHVLEGGNPDAERVRLGGEEIDFGSFCNLVHQHDLSRSISITLSYKGEPKNEAYFPPELYYSEINQTTRMSDCYFVEEGSVDVRGWRDINDLSVRISTAWDMEAKCAFVAMYEVCLNGVLFGRVTREPGQDPFLTVNTDHAFFSEGAMEEYRNYARSVMQAISERFAVLRAEEELAILEKFISMTPAEQDAKLASMRGTLGASYHAGGVVLDGVVPVWGRPMFIKGIHNDETWALSQFLAGAGESVLEDLRGLRHLGPLRVIPSRGYSAPRRAEESQWANGLGAWDALLRSSPQDGIVAKCSNYMNDALQLGYTLSKADRIQLDADSDIVAQLQLLATHDKEHDSEELRQRVLAPLQALPRVPVVQLHDERNGIDVDPIDIGVGVSQALPVVVGAADPNCSIFAAEQPELHIHPAVQSKMGDLFLREALGVGGARRIFLLETHSEHLILRFLRRIRETTADKLPTDFPPVHVDDIQVVYVRSEDGNVVLYPQTVTPDGDFENDWPDGFFTEREEDLFQ